MVHMDVYCNAADEKEHLGMKCPLKDEQLNEEEQLSVHGDIMVW